MDSRLRLCSARRVLLFTLLLTPLVPVSTQAQAPAYVIGEQDVLQVTVFNQPELTGRFPVGADGSITFPFIGSVKASGLTLRGLEAELTGKLSKSLLRNPQVTVAMEAFRSQQFFVIGEVRQPGSFFLSGEETLLQAIARAGYTTADAGSEVLIVRPRDPSAAKSGPTRPDQAGTSEVIRVSLERVASGMLEENVKIQDGDTIFVNRAENVYILGQVRNPGAYRLTKNLTVVQLVSMAGGLTERGEGKRIKVTRMVNGKRQELKIGLDDLVRANDTITVPEKWF